MATRCHVHRRYSPSTPSRPSPVSLFVLDASVAVAWLLGEDTASRADLALVRLEDDEALVPNLWHSELRNGLLVAVRRGRFTADGPAERLNALYDRPFVPIRSPIWTSHSPWPRDTVCRSTTPSIWNWLPSQSVDATQALNLSAGVSNPNVLRGRSFSCRATLLRCACEYTDKSVPLGKYCLSSPLVFSLDPRCHGLCGSQK